MTVRDLYRVWSWDYLERIARLLPQTPVDEESRAMFLLLVAAYVDEPEKPPVAQFLRWVRCASSLERFLAGSGTFKMGGPYDTLGALGRQFTTGRETSDSRLTRRCVLLRFLGPWRGRSRRRLLMLVPIGTTDPVVVCTGRFKEFERHLRDQGILADWDTDRETVAYWANLDSDDWDEVAVPPPDFTDLDLAGATWISHETGYSARLCERLLHYGIPLGAHVMHRDEPLRVVEVLVRNGQPWRLLRGEDIYGRVWEVRIDDLSLAWTPIHHEGDD